jgi:YVTN family beta-propeller protein
MPQSLLAVALIVQLAALPAAQGKEYLYVENSHSGDITVVAIPEHRVVGSFPSGPRPDDVVASPDGRVLYVNNQRDGDGGQNEVIALDTRNGDVLWRVAFDGLPHHMSLSPDGRWLYVPFFDRNHTAVVDTRNKRETRRIFGVLGGHGTRLSEDGRRLYIGSMLTDAMYVVDVESGRPEKAINFDDGVRPFAFTADETRLYAQLSRLHGFDVVDLEEGVVVDRILLPPLPEGAPVMQSFPHTVNHGLELSPDGRYLLAAGSAADYVAVYTHPELELVKTIATGKEPNWIVFNRDGRYAYVTARASNEISVIDMRSLAEAARLASTGDYPQRMRVVDVPEPLALPEAAL